MLATNESIVHTSQMNIYLRRTHHSGLLIMVLIEVVNRLSMNFGNLLTTWRLLIFIRRGYSLRHFSYGVKHFYGRMKPRVSGRPEQIGARVSTGSWNSADFIYAGSSLAPAVAPTRIINLSRSVIEISSSVKVKCTRWSFVHAAERIVFSSFFFLYTRLQPFTLHIFLRYLRHINSVTC